MRFPIYMHSLLKIKVKFIRWNQQFRHNPYSKFDDNILSFEMLFLKDVTICLKRDGHGRVWKNDDQFRRYDKHCSKQR